MAFLSWFVPTAQASEALVAEIAPSVTSLTLFGSGLGVGVTDQILREGAAPAGSRRTAAAARARTAPPRGTSQRDVTTLFYETKAPAD